MKVLWFSSSPSNASLEFGYTHLGRGWISALETIISESAEYQLAICSIYKGNKFKKLEKNNVVYYGIPTKKLNGFQRIVNRQFAKLDDEFESEYYDEILRDFSPDVIHVFGTENGFGKVLVSKFDKVIFHLQGLAAPYYGVYFPQKVSKMKVLFYDNLNNIVRGLTFYHSYKSFGKIAQRENFLATEWKYFSGRTDYDRNYIKLINPKVQYFHCEELLRPDFFLTAWKGVEINYKKTVIHIGTTINPNIYKGLDLIYKTLPLLSDYKIIWNVYGFSEEDKLNKVVKKCMKIKKSGKLMVFHGPLPASDLINELKKCHFFVHPSYIDNSPNSVCEAMLLGMPVIASSVGGMKTLINNEVNGFLFNPQDKYDLAGLIVYLINNYDLAISAGKRARETAQKRHNSTEIFGVISKMYKAVIDDVNN